MTAVELLEAIGHVDDDLIQEAEEYRSPKRQTFFRYWKPLAGGLAACLVLAALFHLPLGISTSGGGAASTSGTSQSESATAGSGSSGASAGGEAGAPENDSNSASEPQAPEAEEHPQDLLRTPEGTYTLTGEMVSALPEGSRQMGVLFLEGEDSASGLYTSRKEYAGCMLWQAPDGTLYVQIPGGGYAVGRAGE